MRFWVFWETQYALLNCAHRTYHFHKSSKKKVYLCLSLLVSFASPMFYKRFILLDPIAVVFLLFFRYVQISTAFSEISASIWSVVGESNLFCTLSSTNFLTLASLVPQLKLPAGQADTFMRTDTHRHNVVTVCFGISNLRMCLIFVLAVNFLGVFPFFRLFSVEALMHCVHAIWSICSHFLTESKTSLSVDVLGEQFSIEFICLKNLSLHITHHSALLNWLKMHKDALLPQGS